MTAVPTVPADWRAAVARLQGTPLLLLLDVDGTLAPIVSRPEEAGVPDETKRVLAALVERPGVEIALVSGRGAADARRMVGVPGLWTIGNHGIETVAPDGTISVDERAAPFRAALAEVTRRLESQIGAVPGVIVENKTWTLSVHYRNVDPSAVPRVRETAERAAEEAGLSAFSGKMIVELRPPVEVHKGSAVLALVHRLGGDAPGAAILAAGDDRTDEDMFAALRRGHPDALTIRVAAHDEAHPETAAELVVADVMAVRLILETLLAAR